MQLQHDEQRVVLPQPERLYDRMMGAARQDCDSVRLATERAPEWAREMVGLIDAALDEVAKMPNRTPTDRLARAEMLRAWIRQLAGSQRDMLRAAG